MALMDKLGGLAKNLGDKASEAAETVKLNSRVSTEKKAADELTAKLGAMRYAAYQKGEVFPEPEAELCRGIDGHNATIAGLQAELERIRRNDQSAVLTQTVHAPGTLFCPNCGAAVTPGTAFCVGCGAKQQ